MPLIGRPFLNSNQHPLHLDERNFLSAAVVKLRRARRGVVRHLRGAFKRAAILQIGSDARGPKGVVADARGDAHGFGAPLKSSHRGLIAESSRKSTLSRTVRNSKGFAFLSGNRTVAGQPIKCPKTVRHNGFSDNSIRGRVYGRHYRAFSGRFSHDPKQGERFAAREITRRARHGFLPTARPS